MLRLLDRNAAYEMLMEASRLNPGKWVDHSITVAKTCEKLAMSLNVDSERAYVIGLMHDIGRRCGVTGTRHSIDGYMFLKNQGFEDIGRYCITHSYFVKDIRNIVGKWDYTKEEENFVTDFLNTINYDIYDKLVQISDCMSLPNGVTIIERRLVDVHLRNGINESVVDTWKNLYKIQAEIENELGYSIYKLFPEAKENIDTKLIKEVLTF